MQVFPALESVGDQHLLIIVTSTLSFEESCVEQMLAHHFVAVENDLTFALGVWRCHVLCFRLVRGQDRAARSLMLIAVESRLLRLLLLLWASHLVHIAATRQVALVLLLYYLFHVSHGLRVRGIAHGGRVPLLAAAYLLIRRGYILLVVSPARHLLPIGFDLGDLLAAPRTVRLARHLLLTHLTPSAVRLRTTL